MHATLLHGSMAGAEATRLAVAGADSRRGFASAMPSAEEGGGATGRGQKSTGNFFRPVEKLANGVAIIRWDAATVSFVAHFVRAWDVGVSSR